MQARSRSFAQLSESAMQDIIRRWYQREAVATESQYREVLVKCAPERKQEYIEELGFVETGLHGHYDLSLEALAKKRAHSTLAWQKSGMSHALGRHDLKCGFPALNFRFANRNTPLTSEYSRRMDELGLSRLWHSNANFSNFETLLPCNANAWCKMKFSYWEIPTRGCSNRNGSRSASPEVSSTSSALKERPLPA